MTINPDTHEHFKRVQAIEIEAIRNRISKLPVDTQKLVAQGINVIEGHFVHKKNVLNEKDLDVSGLNVFDLGQDIPGDVMKHLAMLYVAAGFHDVSISCKGFHSEHSGYVKFPNSISFKQKP